MIDSALVFKLADSISARLRALVIVAGFVGLRTGELLGLRRCDVDLEEARLTVLVQAQQVELPSVLTHGAATKTTARSRRNDVVVAAFLGFVLGLIAALAWDPIVSRRRP